MNIGNRLIFFIVLSLVIWTSSLQATEKKAANEQVKEEFSSDSTVDTLPVKPTEKILEEKLSFNSWIDEGFLRLKNQITDAEIYKLRILCLKKGGLFEITTQDGRTIEDMDSLIKKLETMKEEGNPYIQTFKETFIPLMKSTRQEIHHFLTSNTVYKGLEEDSKPDEMIAHWLWYGYMYAHDPNKLGPLFTREFRKKIYANQYPVAGDEEYDPRSIYDFLEELLELYYEYGIKYFKNDTTVSKLIDQTFENIKSTLGPYVVRKGKHSLILTEKEEDGGLMWKFEDDAWRFNGSVMPNTKEQ